MHADCSWVSTGQEVARKIAFLDIDMHHCQLLKHTQPLCLRGAPLACVCPLSITLLPFCLLHLYHNLPMLQITFPT